MTSQVESIYRVLVERAEAMTRREIADALGMERGEVAARVAVLLKQGRVVEVRERDRPPREGGAALIMATGREAAARRAVADAISEYNDGEFTPAELEAELARIAQEYPDQSALLPRWIEFYSNDETLFSSVPDPIYGWRNARDFRVPSA